METVTLATVISSIGTIFTAGLGWVGQTAATVAAEPLLLLPYGLAFIGIGIGLFGSLAHR